MNLRNIVASAILLTLSSNIAASDIKLILPDTSALTAMKYSNHLKSTKLEQNSDKLFIPASTMKLLTAIAATASLGSEFRYQTKVLANTPIQKGKIDGDVYIVFSGDPTLTTLNIESLFAQLQQQGLALITGNIYLVGEEHELQHAPGRVWDDLGICYSAPVSSFIINENCFKARFVPRLADDAGEVKIVGNEPVSIESRAVFDKSLQQPICDLTLARLENNHFRLDGCYPGSKPLKLNIAITDPALFAKDKLTQIVKNTKIGLRGQVLFASQFPAYSLSIAEHQSEPLTELVATMLLKSDNLIADSLLKRLGQQVYGAPGTFSSGSAAMKLILTQQGIDLSNAHIVDGSGLSRYNLLSANQLAEVLALVRDNSAYRHIISSLPVAGESGTLKYRKGYVNASLKGKVLAKTGSMLGVSNVAGFIKDGDKIAATFVVLQNGVSPEKEPSAKPSFDVSILQQLTEQ
ncbi:D-alanyl-D-alanine carboxypeptidase/D-alanyl-D-alanine endopeptidase [Shewanella kaireitica]|uniref:D-alanyl-D-alanine carboxypeptidase/D-alanyl-D-alanine endopeptidase n=1 Tax=Shewanella kaireitica TaxID=212021 RepID=UPI0020107C47|nr:D-alanyl-D-alanine carboxypeptidase/D-alanyl-D-alanine-endopeptidase [Shewanella kaireitica]MCL1096034.1 D-alanyl-D-alanine carboxypeptidase/D-alanyl-D-alanine-endopeptidase [Shewanella kaireitica]